MGVGACTVYVRGVYSNMKQYSSNPISIFVYHFSPPPPSPSPLQGGLPWCQPGGSQSCGGDGRVLEPLSRCAGCLQGVPLWTAETVPHLSTCLGWNHGAEGVPAADFKAGNVWYVWNGGWGRGRGL